MMHNEPRDGLNRNGIATCCGLKLRFRDLLTHPVLFPQTWSSVDLGERHGDVLNAGCVGNFACKPKDKVIGCLLFRTESREKWEDHPSHG